MSNLMLDVDQAGELKAAFRRGNWTNKEIKKLCEGDILAKVREVVLGYASIAGADHAVDCNALNFSAPQGHVVEEHRSDDSFVWDPSKVELFYADGQKNGKSLDGVTLKWELKGTGKTILNANVLDYLLDHPHLIPDEWKGKYVCFWGTTYRNVKRGDLCVRGLLWHSDNESWGASITWLDEEFDGNFPAAVCKS